MKEWKSKGMSKVVVTKGGLKIEEKLTPNSIHDYLTSPM